MSWKEYANRFGSAGAATPKASGDLVTVTEHLENALGVQAEFEARWAGMVWPGILSGMAPTEDEVNDEIDIAAGVALVNGLKAVGGVSVSLTGKGAETYYIYVDPDEATQANAYKAKVAVPDVDELLLARCAWNGSDTITGFVDLRQRGVQPYIMRWGVGTDIALSAYDAKIASAFLAPADLCLRRIMARVVTCGSADSTIIDVHTGAIGSTTSIWSAAGDRITVAHDATDGALVNAAVADQNFLVSRGQLIEVHIDAVATGALGLEIVIPATMY